MYEYNIFGKFKECFTVCNIFFRDILLNFRFRSALEEIFNFNMPKPVKWSHNYFLNIIKFPELFIINNKSQIKSSYSNKSVFIYLYFGCIAFMGK